jgi:hypothetical protein
MEYVYKPTSYTEFITEKRKRVVYNPLFNMAGETRLEHATNGFGDHYSTN